jgi:hypothetical protein
LGGEGGGRILKKENNFCFQFVHVLLVDWQLCYATLQILKKNSVALVRKRTIPTERPPLSAK